MAFTLAIHFASCSATAQGGPDPDLENRLNNTIRARGTVESDRSAEIRCEVVGGSTILSIVPDGSQVEKDDLLVELDDSGLRDSRAAAEIQLQQSKAEHLRGEAELQAARQQGEAMLRVAEQELRTTELSRERTLGDGGELAYQLAAVNSELVVAKKRLEIAENLLTKANGERGGKSITDLRLSMLEAREAIKVAEVHKKFLETHEREYRAAMLNLAMAQKQLQMVRLKGEQERSIRMAEAEMLAKGAALAQNEQQLDRLTQQIERCRIHAPRAGMVVYANASASQTGRTAAIEEGARVRGGQSLLQIPDLKHLRVRTRVNESHIARVRIGQDATIHCDAFPDKTLHGKVILVSRYPERFLRPIADKLYTVLVSIESPTASLKIGLTALVEIDAGSVED